MMSRISAKWIFLKVGAVYSTLFPEDGNIQFWLILSHFFFFPLFWRGVHRRLPQCTARRHCRHVRARHVAFPFFWSFFLKIGAHICSGRSVLRSYIHVYKCAVRTSRCVSRLRWHYCVVLHSLSFLCRFPLSLLIVRIDTYAHKHTHTHTHTHTRTHSTLSLYCFSVNRGFLGFHRMLPRIPARRHRRNIRAYCLLFPFEMTLLFSACCLPLSLYSFFLFRLLVSCFSS